MAEITLGAVDLGAQSGRIAVGCYDGRRLSLEIVTRFANVPLRLPDGLFWNITALFEQMLAGLAGASAASPLASVGIDAWGCDYVLLDSEFHVLGLPYHHRDERRTADAALQRAFSRVGRAELYARTGIQMMAINTLFQLLAEPDDGALAVAERIAFIPELLGMWLTGELVNELTIASTSALLDAGSGRWASDLIERLGLPSRPFSGTLSAPATALGSILPEHGASAGALAGTPVITVASHDTASAFAAAHRRGPDFAVLSSGTWSLLGVELDGPHVDERACEFNLTNERGLEGGVRLLRNVMGMWLVEECRREWQMDAAGYEGLVAQLDSALVGRNLESAEVPLFDPDEDSLLHAGPMSGRIVQLCRRSGQAPPATHTEVLGSILVSLACKYRLVIERLEAVTGTRIDTVQILGGGSRNRVLSQITADVLEREVLAGPQEASALGNLLTQLYAAGELSSVEQMRALSARSVEVERFLPCAGGATETYERFLSVTGSSSPAPPQVRA